MDGNKLNHPVLRILRDLRKATGLSLKDVQEKYGHNAMVVGSYERGDRQPTLKKVEDILSLYGYTLIAQKKDETSIRLPGEIVQELRGIADQLEKTHALRSVPQQQSFAA